MCRVKQGFVKESPSDQARHHLIEQCHRYITSQRAHELIADHVRPLDEISLSVYRTEQAEGYDLALETELSRDRSYLLILEEVHIQGEVVESKFARS